MRQEPKLIPQTLNGDLRRGGWILSGYIEGDTDAVSYGDNWILRAKSGSLSQDPEWRQIFNGTILEEPDNITVGRYKSRVAVRAGTIDNLLKGDLQAIGFTEQSSPANDHQLTGLQLADIVQHILDSHCNAIFNATTMPDGLVTSTSIDTTNSVPLERYNVGKSSNLWRSLQNIGGGEKAGEFYTIWCDRANKIYYEPTPNFWTTPPTSKGTLTKDHIRSLSIKRNSNRPGEKIGQVSLTAIKNSSTVFTSSRPANAADGKRLPPRDGIFADTQAKTNTLAQRLYDWLTRAYTVTVEVDPGLVLFGDDGVGLDLADKVSITYDGPTEDTSTQAGLHINFSAQAFFVYGINIRFDAFGKMATATLTLEQDPT